MGRGSGSIEEVVVDECTDVSQRKTKRQKLIENSSSPIKTTQLESDSSGFQYKQSSHSPLLKSKGVTAVMAMLVEPTGDQINQVGQVKLLDINPNIRSLKLVAKRSRSLN